MKNILCALLCVMPISSFATQMCVEDDVIAVVLNTTISSTTSTVYPVSDGGDGSGVVTFSYGKIYGMSTCVSANYGSIVNEITDNGAVVVGGERNGNFCYCRLTHPVVSKWIYRSSGNSNCSSNCPKTCFIQSGSIGSNLDTRKTFFTAIDD